MRLVCSGSVEEAGADDPDVLVLPERTTTAEIRAATARWPQAIIIGATAEGKLIRGRLVEDGTDHINYLKFSDDRTSDGTHSVPECLTFENDRIAVGVLICKDFQQAHLRRSVMEQLAAARAPLRLVCISADMGPEWFPGNTVNLFLGAYLAVSNNRRTPAHTRRRSFIAGPDGAYRLQQSNFEAISVDAP
jgi:hypothetical protein